VARARARAARTPPKHPAVPVHVSTALPAHFARRSQPTTSRAGQRTGKQRRRGNRLPLPAECRDSSCPRANGVATTRDRSVTAGAAAAAAAVAATAADAFGRRAQRHPTAPAARRQRALTQLLSTSPSPQLPREPPPSCPHYPQWAHPSLLRPKTVVAAAAVTATATRRTADGLWPTLGPSPRPSPTAVRRWSCHTAAAAAAIGAIH